MSDRAWWNRHGIQWRAVIAVFVITGTLVCPGIAAFAEEEKAGDVGSRAVGDPKLMPSAGPLLKRPGVQEAVASGPQPWVRVTQPAEEFRPQGVQVTITAGGFTLPGATFNLTAGNFRSSAPMVPATLPDGTLGVTGLGISIQGQPGIVPVNMVLSAPSGQRQEASTTFEFRTFARTPVAGPLSSWSRRILDVGQRFVVLTEFRNEAVLDQETGLVWQLDATGQPLAWDQARAACRLSMTGGRQGWRLPTLSEIQTIQDCWGGWCGFPTGHPFRIPVAIAFWTASVERQPNGTDGAWVYPGTQGLQSFALNAPWWCVRGPSSSAAAR